MHGFLCTSSFWLSLLSGNSEWWLKSLIGLRIFICLGSNIGWNQINKAWWGLRNFQLCLHCLSSFYDFMRLCHHFCAYVHHLFLTLIPFWFKFYSTTQKSSQLRRMEMLILKQRLFPLKMEASWKVKIKMLHWIVLVLLISMINGLDLQCMVLAQNHDTRYCLASNS